MYAYVYVLAHSEACVYISFFLHMTNSAMYICTCMHASAHESEKRFFFVCAGSREFGGIVETAGSGSQNSSSSLSGKVFFEKY